MTIQEKAAAWIAEVGKTQAIIECKQAIVKLEYQMDTKGYTPNDLAYLREYQNILKELQNTTT
jgi:hypothetical protein